MGRRFLVEGNTDIDEGFEGEVLAYGRGGAMVGVEIEEIEQGFCFGNQIDSLRLL